MVRGLLRLCVGLGSEPDDGARIGPFVRANLHPRRNPLERQGCFAPQPGSDGQLGGGAAPASSPLGLRPAPARQLLRDDTVGPLKTGKWDFPPFSCLQSSCPYDFALNRALEL